MARLVVSPWFGASAVVLCVFWCIPATVAQEGDSPRHKRNVDPKASENDNDTPPLGGGQTYVRWGRTSCPTYKDTHLVYKGVGGGTWFEHKGGGANLLCLHEEPVWDTYDDKFTGHVHLHGVEYETGWPLENDNIEGNSHYGQNMPCAVCLVSHRSAVMIPGRKTCIPGWRLEYHGYLMTSHVGHNRGEYVCIDHAPEADPGGAARKMGVLLYYVEANCGNALRCPPYIHGREITCAVCSK